jgi:hypothetical protein
MLPVQEPFIRPSYTKKTGKFGLNSSNGQIVITSASCMGDRGFESWPRDIYAVSGLTWFSLVPPGKCGYGILKYAITISFHILSTKTIFISRYYTMYAVEKVIKKSRIIMKLLIF